VTPAGPGDPLERLAAARGVAVAYDDAFDTRRTVSPETLVAVLRALGEPIEHPSDAGACLARHRRERELLPPVVVAWDGQLPAAFRRRLTGADTHDTHGTRGATAVGARVQVRALKLTLEDGSDASELLADVIAGGAGTSQRPVPYGVHRLVLEDTSVLVISSPHRARPLEPHSWGVFAPTYALWDGQRAGSGDLSCLARLGAFAGSLGASYLATLPLLADYATADSPGVVASPYSPLSRMWWNEAYLDLARVEGVDPDNLPPPNQPADGFPGQADIAAAATAVRAGLASLVTRAHPGHGPLRAGYERFLRERPDVTRYGAYRVAAQRAGIDRSRWPSRWRAGDIRIGEDVDPADVELHVCAQWLTDSQVEAAAATTRAAGCTLMLDLPIGCRPDGYDPWAFPSSFAGGSDGSPAGASTSVGAPPDLFFGGGQDWGFRPLDPEGERRAGYPVVRSCLRHLLRHAGALRVDHALGFQRLWWIPPGASAADGTYVSYPTDELLALTCLEAWRHSASLIGEDLGTVDPTVRSLMCEHGVAGMSVAVFDLDAAPPLLTAPEGSCAFVDTHDTATFAGWLGGEDIATRRQLGLIDGSAARSERTRRTKATRTLARRLGATEDCRAMHAAVLEELGTSEAGVVIATLEDLWCERDPQNIPGTVGEHVNFARRLALPLSAIENDADVIEPLLRLAAARGRAAKAAGRDQAGNVPPAARPHVIRAG
jgi:4-alpha-glucanotransferase